MRRGHAFRISKISESEDCSYSGEKDSERKRGKKESERAWEIERDRE